MAKKCVHYTNKVVITLSKRKKELQNWLTETCIPKQTINTHPQINTPKNHNSKQRKMGKKNPLRPFWYEKS